MIKSYRMNGAPPGESGALEAFIDQYSAPVFAAIAKLTGLTDQEKIEELTIRTFVHMWKYGPALSSNSMPPAYIYRVVLLYVFTYLKMEGQVDRIRQLQTTLPVSPEHYTFILQQRSI